jgi:hypothetical protein
MVKLFLRLTKQAIRHEDVSGNGCIDHVFLTWHWLEVRGQLNAPVALLPGKEPPVLVGYVAWMGPIAGLDGTYRDFNSDPSVVQPVSSSL